MAKKGLPASIIKKYGVTKKAWAVFRGRKSKSRPARVKTVKAKSRSYKMRRSKRGKRSSSRHLTIPLAIIAGAAAPLAMKAPSGRTLVQDLVNGDLGGLLYDGKEIFTAVDNNGKFQSSWLVKTYLPLGVALLVHWVASKSGFNRALGRAKVPVLRV